MNKNFLNMQRGTVTLIIGPMFAGKTTEMFRRVKRAIFAGENAQIIKHASDTRYSKRKDLASSHDREQLAAISTTVLAPLRNDLIIGKSNIIGIDEGQFYDDLEDFCTWATSEGKNVIVSALDSDFEMNGFENVLKLIPKAENVIKLHAVCVLCKNPAAFTRRIVSGSERLLVGGAESYISTCRKCHNLEFKKEQLEGHQAAIEKIGKMRES